MQTYCVYLLNDSTNSMQDVQKALHSVLNQNKTSTLAEKLMRRVHQEGVACVYESPNENQALNIHRSLRAWGLTVVPFDEKPKRDMPKPDYWKPLYGEWRGMDA